MDFVLTNLFIFLILGVFILILVIFKVVAYSTAVEFLDYLKKHHPAKYFDVSVDRSFGIFSALFPAGNPIEFPIFILSSENLADEKVAEYKRKIRIHYILGLILVIGCFIALMTS